jgi:hypothetical protein
VYRVLLVALCRKPTSPGKVYELVERLAWFEMLKKITVVNRANNEKRKNKQNA